MARAQGARHAAAPRSAAADLAHLQDVIGQTPKPVASRAAAVLLPACAKAANDAAPAVREAAVDCLVGFALKTGVATPAKVCDVQPGLMGFSSSCAPGKRRLRHLVERAWCGSSGPAFA